MTRKVMYLKTTGEAVFTLSEQDGTVTVRRPVAGQDGITHATETFFVDELESFEAANLRKYNEMSAVNTKIMELQKKTVGADDLALPTTTLMN